MDRSNVNQVSRNKVDDMDPLSMFAVQGTSAPSQSVVTSAPVVNESLSVPSFRNQINQPAASQSKTSSGRRPVVTSIYASKPANVPAPPQPVPVASPQPASPPPAVNNSSQNILPGFQVPTIPNLAAMATMANNSMASINSTMNSNLATMTAIPGMPNFMGTMPAPAAAARSRTSVPRGLEVNQQDASAVNSSLLSGEQVVMCLHDATIVLHTNKRFAGRLYMTNYRILFVLPPSVLRAQLNVNPALLSWLTIPLGAIDKIEKERHAKDASHTWFSVMIHCKDCRVVRLTVQGLTFAASAPDASKTRQELSAIDIERALAVMETWAFPNNIANVFAFYHTLSAEYPRVAPYSTQQEFSRQGILDQNNPGVAAVWRFSDINRNFGLCDSYPRMLVVPKPMSDHELMQVANFRSGKRLPTLSWGDSGSGATLWRSSQPKSGVSGSSQADEKFLSHIANSCVSKISPLGIKTRVRNAELFIVDCRAKTSAMANRAAGAGYENISNYPYAKLEFYSIGNIHTMRDSLKQLNNVMQSFNGSDVHFGRSIEDTQWLSHVRHVIKAGYDCAVSITKEVPVLVHCSHGWDRTAQVCGVAQLFLDPFFRTFDGFPSLIEKEFLSFGHPLQMRSCHGENPSSRDNENMSPILLQFLDCVWQLVNQYPHYFEYNKRYVLTIAEHVYSCRFGTFLFNCDQDREKYASQNRSVDIWSYLFHNRSSFYNPFYQSPFEEGTSTLMTFLPPASEILRNVTLWADFYSRWSSMPTMILPPADLYAALVEESGYARSPEFVDESCQTVPSSLMPNDLQLPFAVCNDSVWHAAYIAERERREQLEKQISRGSGDATAAPVAQAPKRRVSITAADTAAAAKPARPPNEVVMDNLILLLRNKGVPDSEIRDAVLHGKVGQPSAAVDEEDEEEDEDSEQIPESEPFDTEGSVVSDHSDPDAVKPIRPAHADDDDNVDAYERASNSDSEDVVIPLADVDLNDPVEHSHGTAALPSPDVGHVEGEWL